MSSGGAVPPPFNPFSFPLFSPSPQLNFQQQQRYKIKRQRQRVDAGEPRNSYQGLKAGGNEALAALFPSWMGPMDGEYKEEQPTDLSVREEGQDEDLTDELDQLDVETNEDKLMDEPKDEDSRPINDSPASNESVSSSSSKRKQTQPQKNPVDSATSEENGTSDENADDMVEQSMSPTPTLLDQESENPLDKLSALQSQLTSPNLHDMMEAQRRLCNNMFEQQKKLLQQQNEEKPKMRDFSLLAQALKTELNENLSSIVDKILKEWAADIARLTAEAQRPTAMPPMFPPFSQPNPLGFGIPPGPPSGIFPPFNGFNPLAALSSLRRPMMDDDIKRKRAKVTDSVRKLNGGTPLGRESPCSGRSSPQLNLTGASLASYFPPTMVGHPLYGGAAFPDREDSPTNSDDNSDCGPYDASQSTSLSSTHLRKAKLMFFFTRYPNSTLLKSYFPDIRFNKNNTAQLVKWFSNFREFYYNQMDKFARQALAEGVTNREQIMVTMDSEIMKALNQHYNRNNHIQPPDRLVFVVQETLREFFDAIRMGKDSEASWKKTIYKIINRLDDPIPEYFKDPNFLERLEQQ